uniref:Peptidase S1 domain-containing protein n=1 Tax=Sciurus vulgaris TaxID=55149 RepID=A0A8D2DVP3_SCIVU
MGPSSILHPTLCQPGPVLFPAWAHAGLAHSFQMLNLLLLVLPLLSSLVHGAPVPGAALERMGIVGGREAPESRWPWQVSLRVNTRYWEHLCEAPLSTAVGATAAHCLGPAIRSPELFRLQLRQQHLYYRDQLCYDAHEGDLALLELEEPVDLPDHVHPVSLPPASEAFPSGTPCWGTGCSLFSHPRAPPTTISPEAGENPIVENHLCDRQYHMGLYTGDSVHIIRDDMLCAGNKGRDSCQVGPFPLPLLCRPLTPPSLLVQC